MLLSCNFIFDTIQCIHMFVKGSSAFLQYCDLFMGVAYLHINRYNSA